MNTAKHTPGPWIYSKSGFIRASNSGNVREIFSELNEYENGVMKPIHAALQRTGS